jgi:hypothetical protein
VKTPREENVSKAYFDYRYRTRSEHFADLAIVSDDYCGAEDDIVIVNVDLSHALSGHGHRHFPSLYISSRDSSRSSTS